MFLFQIGVLYPVSLFLSPLYKEHLCSPNTQMSALYVVSIFVGEHQSYNARNRLSRIKYNRMIRRRRTFYTTSIMAI